MKYYAVNFHKSYETVNLRKNFLMFIEQNLQNEVSNQYTIVQPKIDQCGRIRVAAEIFGSVLTPRYKKILTFWQNLFKVII